MPSSKRVCSLLAVLLAASLGACAPSLSPLYRDYEIHAQDEDVKAQITAALEEAGWSIVPGSAPNVIATEERKVNSWLIYDVVVSLEAVPMGEEYVRLYVHPYRKYFTGSRSKIPYLKKGLAGSLLEDLNEALERRGLQAIGTSVSRDRQAAAR